MQEHGTTEKPLWSCEPDPEQWSGLYCVTADVGADHPVLQGTFYAPAEAINPTAMLARVIAMMEHKIDERRAGLCPCGDCH